MTCTVNQYEPTEVIDEIYLLHMNVFFLLSAMDQIELFPPVCKAAAPESIILDN